MNVILRALAVIGTITAAGGSGVLAQDSQRPQPRPADLVAVDPDENPDAAALTDAESDVQADGATGAPAPRPRPAETPALAAPKIAPPAEPAAAASPAAPPRDPGRGSVTNLPLPRYVSLKGNEGNARRGPGLTHRIDWVFTRAGMPLRITAEHEHWRRIEDAEGAGGWVHYALLSGVRSVLIAADLADVHARPDDGSPIEFRAERNVVGKVQECQPDWCRISINGERGWVRKADLWGVAPGEIIE